MAMLESELEVMPSHSFDQHGAATASGLETPELWEPFSHREEHQAALPMERGKV